MKSAHTTAIGSSHAKEWPSEAALEIFPNPSNGPVFVTYTVPDGITDAQLRVVDLSGRELGSRRLGSGPGVWELQTTRWSSGAYLVELRLDNVVTTTAKVVLQN
jgi:hypothetical protein